MIKCNGVAVAGIYQVSDVISAVYHGAHLVFQKVPMITIPTDGLNLWFKPRREWNTDKPSVITDETGNYSFNVDATNWDGEQFGVLGDGYFRASVGNEIKTKEQSVISLVDGFSAILCFRITKAMNQVYFNFLSRVDQLAFIYGYDGSKIEFYNWSKIIDPLFRSLSKTQVTDTSKHFACITYDSKTGSATWYFDGTKKTATVNKAVLGLGNGDSTVRLSPTGANFADVGNQLLYTRPLSESEVMEIKHTIFD